MSESTSQAAVGRPPSAAGLPPSWRASLRQGLRWVRRAPERWLHGRRRRSALASLRGGAAPRSVLFVCHGNVYRSPFAEAVFAASLPASLRGAVRALSAGFVGPDRPSPPAAVELAARRGVDLQPHQSRLLSPELVEAADLVVVMSAGQQRAIRERFGARRNVLVLGDLDPEPIDEREIVDPWRETGDVLERSYARVERCVAELTAALAAEAPRQGERR